MHAGFHCAWKFRVWLLDLEIIKLVGKKASAGKWTFFLRYTEHCGLATKLLSVKTKQNRTQFKCGMKMKPIFIVSAQW